MTYFTLLRIFLADFDLDALRQAEPIIGPAFFFAYIFFILVIFAVSILNPDELS